MDDDGKYSDKLLHQAALYGNEELLADLLAGEWKHKLNCSDRQGHTPLHVAASSGSSGCTKLLLDNGAETQCYTLNDFDAKTPLHLAAEKGHVLVVQLLVDAGADLYATDRSGNTALELAQRGGHMGVFEYLCEYVQNRAKRHQDAQTALENFCTSGNVTAAEEVLKSLGKDLLEVINGMPSEQHTLLYRACERGQTSVVQLLLRYGADCRIHPVTQYSPLYISVYAGHKEIVEILLKEFPSLVQTPTFEQWLPIHAAARTGSVPLLKALLSFAYPRYMLQTFIDATAQWEYELPCDVNALDADGRTPLYLACMYGHMRTVKFLLDYEVAAHPALTSPHTRSASPAVEALSQVQPSVNSSVEEETHHAGESSEHSVQKNLKPVCLDLLSSRGRTALHEAVIAQHSEIAKLLIDRGADMNLSIVVTDEELKRLETDDVPIIGSTALSEACKTKDLDLANYLLDKGATDQDHKALGVCLKLDLEQLICRMLVNSVFADPEFRVNKKAVELDVQSQFQKGGARGIASVIPSTLFPSIAVMLNWHNLGLSRLQESWLTAACISLNPKLKPSSQLALITSAVTRIDISKNELVELPVSLFQMVSLRILNASHNKLESLPAMVVATSGAKEQSRWSAQALEELHFQNNRLAALPDAVFELPNLVTLDVSNNRLTSLSPKMWTAPKLKDLNAAFNNLGCLPLLKEVTKPRIGGISPEATGLEGEAKEGQFLGKPAVSPSVSINSAERTPLTATGSDKSESADESTAEADGRFKQDEGVSYIELKHHNLWQKSIELSQAFADDDLILPATSADRNGDRGAGGRKSCLTSLNLSHNQFRVLPEGLACLAPNLGRLNLAFNELRQMGPINYYPVRLKHLDLSCNHIQTWFKEPNVACATDLYCLGRAVTTGPDGAVVARPPSSPILGRRSQSVHRSSSRSLSVARVGEISAPSSVLASFCAHRRHQRLDNLRTLILAGNELVSIQLYLPEAPVSAPSSGTGVRPHGSQRQRLSSTTSSRRSSKHSVSTASDASQPSSPQRRHSQLQIKAFPNLTMLDLSANRLVNVPEVISQLTSLSVLNLSQNVGITSLPAEMGLLSKLWNLNVTGCSLGEPLKSMLESHKYKTIDIIGYLKSVLEDSKLYSRLKLMIVGVQGIGKTSLLEQLRLEGSGSYKKAPAEGWAKRMGNKDINRKTAKGVNISTVGVDVNDWTYEPKKDKNQANFGPVTFRTWDFGGQREYYATHQYFLSRRSLYLVVWKITDGEAGVAEIMQWLVNIQARAPNSPVIIVGTHFDEVLANNKKFPTSFVEDLQRLIKERFVGVPDADKRGLPKVVDSVVVSCKTRFNVRVLCNLVYNTAYELRSSGTKERLLEQKIPASYLALEDVVQALARQRIDQGKDPVLSADQYRTMAQDQMFHKFGCRFRDVSELNQATAFLHENGVLLHYEDATLKDLYFLDPQWLCDILAHVITIREINPFAKNGLMKTDDLKILFKSSRFHPTNIRGYILNLLQKFEVALTWDNRMLLIPCLLPDEYQLRGGYRDCEVKLPVKGKGWMPKPGAFMSHSTSEGNIALGALVQSPPTSPSSHLPHKKPAESPRKPLPHSGTIDFGPLNMGGGVPTVSVSRSSVHQLAAKHDPKLAPGGAVPSFVPIFALDRPKTTNQQLEMEFYVSCKRKDEACIRRLYLMSYFPSGFWSRLITRLLGEENLPGIMQHYFRVMATEQGSDLPPEGLELSQLNDRKLNRIVDGKAEWLLWQTGIEIQFLGHTLFCVKEFLPLADIRDVNYKDIKYKYQLEGQWITLNAEHMAVMELYIPQTSLQLRYQAADGSPKMASLESDRQMMTRLLSITVELIDTLLEDWYPSLGTRFVHTAEGKFLVTRLVPCPYCLLLYQKTTEVEAENSWTILSLQPAPAGAPFGTADSVVFHQNLRGGDGAGPMGGLAPPERRRKMSDGSADSGVTSDIGCDAVFNKDSSNSPRGSTASAAAIGPDRRLSQEANAAYSFPIEECILAAHYASMPKCPTHGPLMLNAVSPDVVFLDLGNSYLILPEQVKRGKMLGRGAFGFVFKASIKFRGTTHFIDVAMKMLQPVDPGFGARASAAAAYKAAWSKWQRDPSQYACRAYCTARQELNVLAALRHTNVVSLIGVCPRPLALVVSLAPLGSLNHILQNYRRSGARLSHGVVQEVMLQVARAMEYLHQQHIIYRDLKSENVLVFQFPPPFSQLSAVDVKLGDYGISRNILPTGGTKGFGGTEGFMAPEIMRYNGEEEYTEKVDCFSFGMFVYELLTLQLPFDGQEQVKEFILEGGRPKLSAKEMLYPTNILDLMIVCWSQFPADRPSASQIVSICSAPEFSHLLDVVSIVDSDSAVITAEAFSIEEDNAPEREMIAPLAFEGEAWISRADGQISVLSCGQYGWLDYKSIVVNEDSFVTAVCLVEETVWLGELTGLIRVYCAQTCGELYSFTLAPHILPLCEPTVDRLSVPVVAIEFLPATKRVLIASGNPGALILCRAPSDAANDAGSNAVLFAARAVLTDIHCIACLPATGGGARQEVWAGGPSASLSIFNLAKEPTISPIATIGHFAASGEDGGEPAIDLDVHKMTHSQTSARYVWTYVYPGCTVYQWNTYERSIVARLDCSKLVPCSESINTMSIDEKLSPARCQITSLCLLERDGGSQLYVGTTWGVVVIAEADQLRPITAFRPHLEDVRIILPLGSYHKSIVAAGSGSATSTWTKPSSVGSLVSEVSERGSKSGAPGKPQTYTVEKQSKSYRETNSNAPNFIVTVGKGYRNLIQRFVDLYKEDQPVLDSRNKDAFALIWRTDEWLIG